MNISLRLLVLGCVALQGTTFNLPNTNKYGMVEQCVKSIKAKEKKVLYDALCSCGKGYEFAVKQLAGFEGIKRKINAQLRLSPKIKALHDARIPKRVMKLIRKAFEKNNINIDNITISMDSENGVVMDVNIFIDFSSMVYKKEQCGTTTHSILTDFKVNSYLLRINPKYFNYDDTFIYAIALHESMHLKQGHLIPRYVLSSCLNLNGDIFDENLVKDFYDNQREVTADALPAAFDATTADIMFSCLSEHFRVNSSEAITDVKKIQEAYECYKALILKHYHEIPASVKRCIAQINKAIVLR